MSNEYKNINHRENKKKEELKMQKEKIYANPAKKHIYNIQNPRLILDID
jgi:hypothetical protein